MAKESCLHCALSKAAVEWSRTHNCSTEDFLSMIAKFVAEATVSRPEHSHRKQIDVVILGLKYDHPRGSLH